ncbi:uncharacterized protein [Montipora capricornis]|uniref:uncharacterized protein n=1 Tax=Montipora capricornis TaxID=246305 RepID=UPI0035F1A7F1
MISGLKVNFEETKVLWVGSAKERGPIQYDEPDISWVKGKVFALGVWFAADRNVMLRSNYDERITKIKNVIELWQFRRLTLIGKITLIKSLLVSELVYILILLPTSMEALQKVNKLLFDFPWNSKGDKIKRTVIIKDYNETRLIVPYLRLPEKDFKKTENAYFNQPPTVYETDHMVKVEVSRNFNTTNDPNGVGIDFQK